MTPQEAKRAGTGMTMLRTTFLSHFAQMCGHAKQRFENDIEFPFDGFWFFRPTDEYNPYMAWSAMAICLSGYKNLPSNQYRYIRKSFEALGCEDIDVTSYYHLNDENRIGYERNVDQVSYAFGHRQVRDADGTERTLVVMMLRGTSDTAEWLSNSEVADSISDGDYSTFTNLEGFWNTAEKAKRDLGTYLAAHHLDLSDASQARLWVIGHSRGASIANALAAMIDEEGTFGVSRDRLYVYTFASSRVTMRKDFDGPQFANILNVINPEDYIPRLPPSGWGIRRYGRDLYLPSIATRYADWRTYRQAFLNTFKDWTRMDFPAFHGNAQTNALEWLLPSLCPDVATMYQKKRFSHAGTLTFAQYFTLFTDLAAVQGGELDVKAADFAKYGAGTFEDYLAYFVRNQILGHDANGAHQEEGYLIKLMLCCHDGIDIEQGADTDTTRVSVFGDVDLQVNDASGKVVASIEKGRIDEDLYGTDDFIAMYVDKDTGERSVWVPDEGGYVVSMRAREDGKYDVREGKVHPMGWTVSQRVYAQVPLQKGEIVDWTHTRGGHPHTDVAADRLNAAQARVSVKGVGTLKAGEAFASDYPQGAHTMPIPKPDVVCDAVGSLYMTPGDHVVVDAHHDRHLEFLGWFEPGDVPGPDRPVSTDEKYTFTLDGDRDLVAWFEKK
ncbi:MAG: hypothetical protein UHD09_09575 [Bifidobacterium sp.]|nr:hypothetical protein [Bifidobacterium sp.]